MTVDWMDRPLTDIEEQLHFSFVNTILINGGTSWGDDSLLIELDAALEYWLSRRALMQRHSVGKKVLKGFKHWPDGDVTLKTEVKHLYDYYSNEDIDGPWPSGEYEPRWVK